MTCPKCGSDAGWSGPKYKTYFSLDGPPREWLLYACDTCGYTRSERTKDAPSPPPPENTPVSRRGWPDWHVLFPWLNR